MTLPIIPTTQTGSVVVQRMTEQKAALEWALELPKSIKETGKIARELHKKLPV